MQWGNDRDQTDSRSAESDHTRCKNQRNPWVQEKRKEKSENRHLKIENRDVVESGEPEKQVTESRKLEILTVREEDDRGLDEQKLRKRRLDCHMQIT